MTTLKQSTVYTTTDGKQFPAHKDAKAAQDVIDRTARVDAVIDTMPGHVAGNAIKATEIAAFGPSFLDALTLPSGRAPRKPKVVAA